MEKSYVKIAIGTIVLIVTGIIVVPILINILSPKFVSEISADGLLSYIISVFTATGTILLAYIAVYQNNKFQKENTEIQERLEKLTSDANDISFKMLKIEEAQKSPFVNLIQVRETESIEFLNGKQFTISIKDGASYYCANELDFLNDNGTEVLCLFLKNMSPVEIVSINAIEVAFSVKDLNDQSILTEYRNMEVYNSQDFDGIDVQEKVAFILPFPERIWIENVSLRKSEDQKTVVNVQIAFLITNQYGSNYKERVSFDTINAITSGMFSWHIFNKTFSIEDD